MTRAPRQMLLAAAACMFALVALAAVVYGSARAQWYDFAALDGFVALQREPLTGAANGLAHLFDPAPYALMVAAVLAAAYALRGPRVTAAAALLLLGANVSSQGLRALLAHPRNVVGFPSLDWIRPSGFPSGHTTASMALAFAAVLAAPRAYRPLVALVAGVV